MEGGVSCIATRAGDDSDAACLQRLQSIMPHHFRMPALVSHISFSKRHLTIEDFLVPKGAALPLPSASPPPPAPCRPLSTLSTLSAHTSLPSLLCHLTTEEFLVFRGWGWGGGGYGHNSMQASRVATRVKLLGLRANDKELQSWHYVTKAWGGHTSRIHCRCLSAAALSKCASAAPFTLLPYHTSPTSRRPHTCLVRVVQVHPSRLVAACHQAEAAVHREPHKPHLAVWEGEALCG